jgi:hypothetical protein
MNKENKKNNIFSMFVHFTLLKFKMCGLLYLKFLLSEVQK